MSKINKYIRIIAADTIYGDKMRRLSNRIFGEVVNKSTPVQIHQVVGRFSKKPYHVTDEIVNWYPRHVETTALMKHLRDYGLFRDEHEDFKEEMFRLRTLRGKVKPKKGEGKQAQKKALEASKAK